MKFYKTYFFSILILLNATLVNANTLDIIKYNRLVESIKDKDYDIKKEDEDLTLKLLGKDEKVMHYNLGALYLKQNQLDSAKKQFQYVIQEQEVASNEALLNSAFNMGAILSQEGNVDEAISYYQQALDIDPGHVEAKHNIELLLKQMSQSSDQNKQEDDNEDESSESAGQDEEKPDSTGEKQNVGSSNNNEMLPNQTLSDKEEQAILNELIRQENEIRKRQRHQIKQTDKDW